MKKENKISRRNFIKTTGCAGVALVTSTGLFSGLARAKEEPIKIGASVAASGKYERSGKYQKQGFMTWQMDVNTNRGGLLGRPVKFITYDDKSDPSTGAKLYEKLITQDKVDFVIGPFSSAVTYAITTITEKHKMLCICAGAASPKIFERGYKYIIQIWAPATTQLNGSLYVAKDHDAKTITMINADTAYPVTVAEGAIAKAKELGMEVLYHEAYPKETTDFSTMLARIKSLSPDVEAAGCYLPDGIMITRQTAETGFTPKMLALSMGPLFPDYTESLGKLANGAVSPAKWFYKFPTPGNQRFLNLHQQMYGLPVEKIDYHAAAGFGACQLLEKAVNAVGDPAAGEELRSPSYQKKLRDYLGKTETATVWGDYKVDETGAQIGKKMGLIQIIKQKMEVVWPDKFKTAEPVYPITPWEQR